ncbi:MAG: hypothetical protein ACRD0F_00150, partial [Acidimicrobiales bacterium]
MRTDVGLCTLNFLFLGGDGRRYIGTAGHCVLDKGGEQAWPPGAGPVARAGAGARIGEFAYAVLDDPADFGLVRLDAAVPASPEVCHFGGPTGLYHDLSALPLPVVLHHYGNGSLVGDILPGRTALALGTPDADHVYATGVVLPGDSGSPVTTLDGRAVGVVVTTGLHLGSVG